MLIKRNLLLFFRNKTAVFFSMLSSLIAVGLYVLFLGPLNNDALRDILGFESYLISITIASVMLSGIVALTSVTTCLSGLGRKIIDLENGNLKGFLTTPVSRNKINISYIISSVIISLMLSSITLIFILLYILFLGGGFPNPSNTFKIIVTLILTSVSANAMMSFIMGFIKNLQAFSSFGNIFATLAGFLMGVYLPLGTMPEVMQWIMRILPFSHAASMFRQTIADIHIKQLFDTYYPDGADFFRELYGVTLVFGSFEFNFWYNAAVLFISSLFFYLASIILTSKK